MLSLCVPIVCAKLIRKIYILFNMLGAEGKAMFCLGKKTVLSDSPYSSLVFNLSIQPPSLPQVYFYPFERVPCIILYILLKSYFLSLILN